MPRTPLWQAARRARLLDEMRLVSSAAACAAAGTALATEVASGERCANAARAASVSAWFKRSVSREEARRRRRRLRAASISVSICRLCSPIACLSPLRSESWPSPTPFSIHATACGHNANLSTPTSKRARGVEGDAGKGGNAGKNRSEHGIAFPVSAKRRRHEITLQKAKKGSSF